MNPMMARKEADVLRECMLYLKKCGIFALRMNSGSMVLPGKWGYRKITMNDSGTADILILTWKVNVNTSFYEMLAVWVECKSSVGKQSAKQKVFQKLVESEGHRYGIVRSVAELIALIS